MDKKQARQQADTILQNQRKNLLSLTSTLKKAKMSFPQFFLLSYLSKEEFLTMTGIAKKMKCSTAAATGVVDRLEKLGYVQRVHATHDRRVVMVQVTKKCMDLIEKLRDEIADQLIEAESE